jgi:hypothetical protein
MQNLQQQCILKVKFSFALNEAAHNENVRASAGIAPIAPSILKLDIRWR